MCGKNKTIRALKREELENIAGGREVFGAAVDEAFCDELKKHIDNPDKYNMTEGRYILVERHVNENAQNDYDKVSFTIIGDYDSKMEATKALKPDDDFLGMNMIGEYGLLELVLLSKGLQGHHHL